MRFKADFHTHSADDRHDRLAYSAEELIDRAAAEDVQVLAIACHSRVAWTPRLSEFAERRGVLLIRAAELLIDGKHMVVLNPDAEQAEARSLAEWRRLGRRNTLTIAPHPYYPGSASLGRSLEENIDLFDAIESCGMYWSVWNPNRRAVRLAGRHGLPLVGTSDTHMLPYRTSTFTWVDADALTQDAVFAAIRAGRVTVQTQRPPLSLTFTIGWWFVRDKTLEMLGLIEEA